MLDAIDSIKRFTKGISHKEFLHDEILQLALIKNLEIIGEAANNTTEDLRIKFSDINWKLIIDLRHILVHNYYRVELDVIWETVETDIPKLKGQLKKVVTDR